MCHGTTEYIQYEEYIVDRLHLYLETFLVTSRGSFHEFHGTMVDFRAFDKHVDRAYYDVSPGPYRPVVATAGLYFGMEEGKKEQKTADVVVHTSEQEGC